MNQKNEMEESLSVVIPVYNESKNLPLLHDSLQNALGHLSMSWEVIFVDDGSDDGSLQVLEDLATTKPEHISVVVLRRNFGQTVAITEGLFMLLEILSCSWMLTCRPTRQIYH